MMLAALLVSPWQVLMMYNDWLAVLTAKYSKYYNNTYEEHWKLKLDRKKYYSIYH